MKRDRGLAELYIDGKHVGDVRLQGHDGSWHFGEFEPGPAFTEFAPLFGRWSLLMHEEPGRLPAEAADELRALELALDGLRARLRDARTGSWSRAAQVTIDGNLIDWKVSDWGDWGRDAGSSAESSVARRVG